MNTSTNSDEFPVGKVKAECLGLEIPDINQGLWDMFAAAAEKHSDEEALCSLWQSSDHFSSRLEIEQVDFKTHITPITNENGVGMGTPKSCSAPLRWTLSGFARKPSHWQYGCNSVAVLRVAIL
ncbi:hypothetical protein BPOR_0683g00070 [Botrytis porri]|uniref:Uncharacterized protein n=1 Tax=Botrytis porri TaxID=87229 RepID=A0A4Z1KAY5_9HELO|nr:hypothetical protein BPOR_0683g00070 [Botrytis porri]